MKHVINPDHVLEKLLLISDIPNYIFNITISSLYIHIVLLFFITTVYYESNIFITGKIYESIPERTCSARDQNIASAW